MPRNVVLLLICGASLLALAGLGQVFIFIYVRHPHLLISILITAGFTIGAVAVAVSITAQSVAQVFADRIEFQMKLLGMTARKRVVPWAELLSCDLFHDWKPISPDAHCYPPVYIRKNFAAYSRTIAWTIIMSAGDGVGMQIREGMNFLIGSDDPQKLFRLINESRQAFQAAQPA
jgi:hypothetical protein